MWACFNFYSKSVSEPQIIPYTTKIAMTSWNDVAPIQTARQVAFMAWRQIFIPSLGRRPLSLISGLTEASLWHLCILTGGLTFFLLLIYRSFRLPFCFNPYFSFILNKGDLVTLESLRKIWTYIFQINRSHSGSSLFTLF